MAFCEKCGAVISETMKFCDKCGSPVSNEAAPINSQTQDFDDNVVSSDESAQAKLHESENTVQPEYLENADEQVDSNRNIRMQIDLRGYIDNFLASLPVSITRPGSKVMYFAGIGSLLLLGFVYVICFFSFMSNIAFVVGCKAVPDISLTLFSDSGGKPGASNIWMIVYFIVNLFPITFALISFLNSEKKHYAFFTACTCFVLTFVSLIAWGSCSAREFTEALNTYAVLNSWGVFAWNCLVDCLSEAWYLKIPLSLVTCFALFLDRIINNKKNN